MGWNYTCIGDNCWMCASFFWGALVDWQVQWFRAAQQQIAILSNRIDPLGPKSCGCRSAKAAASCMPNDILTVQLASLKVSVSLCHYVSILPQMIFIPAYSVNPLMIRVCGGGAAEHAHKHNKQLSPSPSKNKQLLVIIFTKLSLSLCLFICIWLFSSLASRRQAAQLAFCDPW